MIGTFSSCLLYTCETAYYNMVAAVKREHHLPGQCSPFDQRLGRRIFPPVNLGQSNFDCSSSLRVWVCKRLTLASVLQHLRLSRRNRPARFFFFAATLKNFSFKQVCSRHTIRVQTQGEQLHQAHLVIPCTVIYPHICASEHFVTVTSDYDHAPCASIQTLCCVPLCTAT